MLVVTDSANGDQAQTEYDGFGRVRRTIDALGNFTEYTYDAASNTVVVSQFGQVEQGVGDAVLLAEATARYDERGRTAFSSQRRFVAGSSPTDLPDVLGPSLSDGDAFVSAEVVYDRSGRVVASVDDDLDTSRVSYDGANRPILSTGPEGNRSRTRYDANSNVLEVIEEDVDSAGSLPVERVVYTTFYDTLDRPTRFLDSLGNETQVGYDSRGNTTHSVDALGNVSRSDFDGLDRIVRVVRDLKNGGKGRGASLDTSNPSNADGQIRNAYRYDDNSNLIAVIDDLGNRTSFDFDAHDRQIRVIQPNGSVHRTYFDRDHNVERTVDPNGTSIAYTYDPLNRLTELRVTPAQAIQADDSPAVLAHNQCWKERAGDSDYVRRLVGELGLDPSLYGKVGDFLFSSMQRKRS